MSNTSLKKIQVPALNHANFGKAIMEQFANIDANFQKLSNFELNSGIPGKSCLYVTINLAAPFVYPTSDINDPQHNAVDFNAWTRWKGYDEKFTEVLQDTWQQLKDSVASDYEQFRKLTGLREYEYARIASKMLWGSSLAFTGSDSDNYPTAASLTGALHAKYGQIEGPINCTGPDGKVDEYYGNWLFEIFKMNTPDFDVMERRAAFFIKHVRISVPGRIIVAISPLDNNMGYYPVGSLEYWYIDPRFRNSAVDRDDTGAYDMSCVMHWTSDGDAEDINWPGHFEILEIFPTIRRGEDGVYYWFINGLNTGIPVQGPAGKDGNSAQLVIVQRVENVLGYDPVNAPNGKIAVGPLTGTWSVPMSAFAGDSPRNFASRGQYVNDLPAIVPQFLDKNGLWPGWPENLEYDKKNIYDRVTNFKLTVDKHTAWLKKKDYGYILNEPENLFRIYRIVGRELFWKGPKTTKIKDENDPVNHKYDPSCDMYYFGADHVSEPDDNSSIQHLIELLDGATAIVLPGPAYQYDRTDSSYWFTTLRKVEWHKSGDNEDVSTKRYMLMAYCSDEERIHTSVDEHTQAGMMQRLDAYSYKSNGDNRNKPRGLMLPIGSAYAAYADGNFDWAWASHIVHSDCGGFTGFANGRGIQQVNQPNRKQTVASDAMHGATGEAEKISEAQFAEVIGKRILHIGSVNDYRALNYVDNNTDKGWNGGVPGRVELTQSLAGKIGNADFYGKMIGGWFEGSELHVDEPMTITRYRDLHKRQRLLNVEGDVVIGYRHHKNGPAITYRNRDGGLIVHSTISPDTGKDKDIFPVNYNPEMSIFNQDWFNGLELTHRAFYRALKDDGKQPWQTMIGRWKYSNDKYRAFYKVDGNAISTDGPVPRTPLKHMFSFLGDDGIGARLVVAQDGLVVYNPAIAPDQKDGKIKSVFSVDAMGNIQTMGSEVRSNADDTLWVFHSRWTAPIEKDEDNNPIPGSYASMAAKGETINWDWLKIDGGDIKNQIFTIPNHNNLMIGTDHEVQFFEGKHNSERRLERSWRATNFYPWENFDVPNIGHYANTELCNVPMGWLFNFGPLDNTGYHMRTFMNDRNNNFGQLWGSNELMPITAIISPDINHFYGVLHVKGIDCMAVRGRAKETRQNPDKLLSGRYGSQIAHGIIVGPARGPIGNQSSPHNFDARDFDNGDLMMEYGSISWQENDDETSTVLGTGVYASDMFTETVNTPIAIWALGSIFAEKTIIADEDLVVNRAATIRAQIRAKSFRRHYSSLNQNSKWAFLLDDGYSSRNAIPVPLIDPDKNGTWREINQTECRNISQNNAISSPIIYDLGEAYGPQRFVKFGYLNNVRTNENYKYRVEGLDNEDDRNIMLFGYQPSESKAAMPGTEQFYLFANGNNATDASKRVHQMSVAGVYNGLMAVVQVKVEMNALFTSRDSHHGGWFHWGSKHYTNAYGFCWQGQTYKPKMKDFDASGEGCVCDGFDWNKVGLEGFPKPLTDSYVFVNSLFQGNSHHNWNVGGTDSARDRVYGIWFKLTPHGTLEIASAHCPGAMNRYPQTITLTFAYPAFPDSLISRKYKICFTEDNQVPANDLTGDALYGGGLGLEIDDISNLPEEWREPSEERPFLWIKTRSGYANSTNKLKWEDLPWTLWKSLPEKQYIAYYVVSNIPNDDQNGFGNWNGDAGNDWPTPILKNEWILGSLGATKRASVTGKADSVLCQDDKNIIRTDHIFPIYLRGGEPDDDATTSDYDGDNSEEAKQAIDWIGGKAKLVKMLLAEGEYAAGNPKACTNAKYIIKVTTYKNFYTNPHTNEYRKSAFSKRKINDGATWEIYLTKEEAFQANQNGGFFGQSPANRGLVGSAAGSGWDKSWRIPEKFLKLPGGEWADNSTFNDVYGNSPVVNTFSVNVETVGKMVIVDLKVALDKVTEGEGAFRGAGIDYDSSCEIVNIATTAYLPAGAPLPDGPVYVSHAALKAWKGGKKGGFNSGRTDGKSFAVDNPTNGIIMKLVGAVEDSSGVQNADATGRFIIERGAHVNCMCSAAQQGPDQWGGVPCPIAVFRFIYKDSGKKMQADKYGNSPYNPSEPGTPGNPGQGGGGGGDADMSSDKWIWTDKDCTVAQIKTWLNKTETSSVKNTIDDMLGANVANGTTMYSNSNYGQVTIERVGNLVKVSMIVTAYKDGASDMSHRSINFTYDSSGNIALIGTYIIGDGESYDDTDLKNRVTALEAQIGGSADADSDVTKLTTVDLGMATISRDKSTFASHLKSVLQRAINAGSLNAADITASASARRRFTLFGPGGYITFGFRGHENNVGTAWRVMVNGQITSNIKKSGSSDWAGCIMMFGTAAKFELSGNNVTSFDCDISCYYSNGPEPIYL